MAGLLAWAADVVGGNGSSSPDRKLHLTAQQWQAVSALDARAAALQHSLQLLRQRIPPSNIAQRLPHLHADSVASHSALALEKHAHAATRHQVCSSLSSLRRVWGLKVLAENYLRMLLHDEGSKNASLMEMINDVGHLEASD